ncbi:trypsin-like peptidase domain-containing protein [Arthrobacter sp. I3]|uniref:trypsin-like peptidase domain-containing protein n=1 Tax=Arthrobacter sp. I3 TaxID=218158 RepID=UPI00138AF40B|nr:trypsin-like peptidase domain-containing protein [Arthrobacter sp. I3]
MAPIELAKPSLMSLRIEMRWKGKSLATGTGFVVTHEDQPYLITNWHNLAGRNPETNDVLSSHGVTPDQVVILHNRAGAIGTWEHRSESVVDENENALWLEHPVGGRAVDVVALPLTQTDGVDLYSYSLEEGPNAPLLSPSTNVNIIGFPFGRASAGGIGIWARGTIASEPYVDYGDWPRFLIDSRTRKGQSGSPVVFYNPKFQPITLKTGNSITYTAPIMELLGVYSGRISEESDIGMVWKTVVVQEILAAAR